MTAKFDWSKYLVKEPEAKSSGFDWSKYEVKQEPSESFNDQATRKLAQIPQGLLEGTRVGIAANALNLFGTGDALAELEELEGRLPELREKFPGLNLPESIDREKYLEAVQNASETFPTVSNIARIIEEQTGIPLQGKDKLDKAIRFISSLSGFKGGNINEALFAGLKGEGTRELLEEIGIPEPISEGLGIYAGLYERSPDVNKYVKKPKLKEGGDSIESSGIPPEGGNPPEPPGGIGPGSELPQTKSSFEAKEDLIKRLQPEPNIIQERLGIDVPIEEGKGAKIKNPKIEETQVGEAISKQPLQSEFKEGTETYQTVQNLAKEARKPVEEAYQKAREVYEPHSDIYPRLSKEVQKIIDNLENVTLRNSGQELVYKQAKAIADLLGNETGYIQVPASKLIAQADAMAQLANYELPYSGYKGTLKKLVKEVNNAVIDSLKGCSKSR